ncbi:MAG: hypothetical protein ABSB35_27240 [Bryobacteraceae bacterium]
MAAQLRVPMLMRYYMHDGPAAFRFELAGDLDANDATRLEQDWRTASSSVGTRTLIIDISFVTAMDEAVQSLFRRWYAGGAKFAARSRRSRELVETLTERRFTPEPARATPVQSWLFRKSMPFAIPAIPLVALLMLLMPSQAWAAELKLEILDAWDRYVRSADAAMQARLRPGSPFLWIDEVPDRRQQLRAGEILVTSVGEHNPSKVPSGLIHHWIGAAFFPNTKLDEVFGVVRDYGHYKDYYHPNVVDSSAIWQTPDADRFSMLVMNKALFMKTGLETEYESTFAQAGRQRWYSTATAVRVQEVEDYGQPSEHKLPFDEGSGFVWKLHSITRYEETVDGVYVEIEAMALSRDIPAAVRWLVDPIVRRVSKGAMTTSLRQTLGAVTTSQAAEGRPVATPGVASGFLKSSLQH